MQFCEECGSLMRAAGSEMVCANEECGHTVAWYTIKQTGSADEPPTRFFKCKECGYRWREYS